MVAAAVVSAAVVPAAVVPAAVVAAAVVAAAVVAAVVALPELPEQPAKRATNRASAQRIARVFFMCILLFLIVYCQRLFWVLPCDRGK